MDATAQVDLSHGNPEPAAYAGKHVFFYDGVCVYCKGIVEACLAGDSAGQFFYSPLQSPFAQRVLGEYGIDSTRLLSMYVVSDFGTSDEALHRAAPAGNFVLRRLAGPLKEVGEQNAAKPRAQQDAEYKDVADHRYERHGIMDSVWLAGGAQRGQFVY
jgi:predicted DCC family thiol-disulfide oxidoreductase YuxK